MKTVRWVLMLVMGIGAGLAFAAHEATIEYAYDDAGRLIEAKYPGNATITYEYDAVGNLIRREVEVPEVEFAAVSGEGDESAGTVNVTVALNEPQGDDVTVQYSVGGSATTGTDHTLGDGAALIPAGDTEYDIPLEVINDDDPERAETVVVTLHSPQGAGLGAATTFTYTLSDEDSEGDMLSDDWERHYFGNLLRDRYDDPDGDRMQNGTEYDLDTDPTRADRLMVWFDTGHETGGDGLQTNLTSLAAALEDAGYTVHERAEPLSATALDPYRALILHDPDADFSADEVTAISDFVDEGGTVLLFAGAETSRGGADLGPLLAEVGMGIGTTVVNENLTTIHDNPLTRGVTAPLATGNGFLPLGGGTPLASYSGQAGVAAGTVAGGSTGFLVAAGTADMVEDGTIGANEEHFVLNCLDYAAASAWEFTINVTGAQTGMDALTIGMTRSDSDDIEAGRDENAPARQGGGTYVAIEHPAGDLMTDFRALKYNESWNLLVDADSARGDVTLTWNVAAVPQRGLSLVEIDVNGELVPGGGNWNMAQVNTITLPAGRTGRLAIRYGQVVFALPLQVGWNAFSLPIVPATPGAATVLDGRQSGPVWWWNPAGYYEEATELRCGQAYWAFVPDLQGEDASWVTVTGTPRDGWTYLDREGWHMLGPICGPPYALQGGLATDPADSVDGWVWEYYRGEYRTPRTVYCGTGYWFHVSGPCDIGLGFDAARRDRGSDEADAEAPLPRGP